MYHTIIVVGNLGRDPEMRYTPSGQAVTNFNVATNRRYTNSDGTQIDETTWFRVSAWGKAAESCNQYLRKGSKVLVEGRLTPDPASGGPRVFTRNDGTPSAAFEINAGVVKFLSERRDDEDGEGGELPGSEERDDVPF